jgi:hypothetical protein
MTKEADLLTIARELGIENENASVEEILDAIRKLRPDPAQELRERRTIIRREAYCSSVMDRMHRVVHWISQELGEEEEVLDLETATMRLIDTYQVRIRLIELERDELLAKGKENV